MPATDVARRQQPRRACKRAATEVETAAAETAESYEMSPSPPKKPVVVAPPPMRVCVIGRYQNKVAASQVRTCDYPAMLQKQSMGCIPMLFEQDTEMLETRLPARQEGGRRASAATPKHGKSALASRQEAAVAAVELNRENYAIDTVYKMEGEFRVQEVQPIKSTTGEGNSKAKACTKPTGLGPVGQAAWYFQPDRSKIFRLEDDHTAVRDHIPSGTTFIKFTFEQGDDGHFGIWGTNGSGLDSESLRRAGIKEYSETEEEEDSDCETESECAYGTEQQRSLQRELRRLARAIISVLPLRTGQRLLAGQPVQPACGAAVTATLIQRNAYQNPCAPPLNHTPRWPCSVLCIRPYNKAPRTLRRHGVN